MITNVGIDIEEVSRFRDKDIGLLNRIFTKKELKNLGEYNVRRVAGIFSAKEAVIKACNPVEKLNFRSIEIMHNKDGSPYVSLKGCKKLSSKDLRMSISHSGDYAVAAAFLVKGGKN